jgi:hypothetical protein
MYSFSHASSVSARGGGLEVVLVAGRLVDPIRAGNGAVSASATIIAAIRCRALPGILYQSLLPLNAPPTTLL